MDRSSDSNIHPLKLHGNTPEKSDDRKNGSAAISVFLSDSVRHFKNIQNTHNTGHISSNFSNDNEKCNPSNDNNDINDNNKNFIYSDNDTSLGNKVNKTKGFESDDVFRKNGALSPGVRGAPKGIKDWIFAANKDIDEIWMLNEIKNSDNKCKNDNPIFSTCFSTSSSTSTSTSNTTSSPPSVANFKVKVILRTRADGPTKVNAIFRFVY